MAQIEEEEVSRGQAVYSPAVLGLYDLFVLGFSNHLLWRCPTRELRALFDRNVGARHLDVGVGTGYYLDRARWPVAEPAITLLDLNANSLSAAAKRIVRFKPSLVQADILKPLPAGLSPYTSVSLSYLLHCLPGAMPDKAAAVFDHLMPVLDNGARVFGATIVQGSEQLGIAARKLMALYNARGIFSNREDRAADLDAVLRARLSDVHVWERGTVALFEARMA